MKDSLEVVKVIQDPDLKSFCLILIGRIRQLLSSVRNWGLDYILREGNKEIDQTAKMSFEIEESLQLFTESLFVDFVDKKIYCFEYIKKVDIQLLIVH